MSLFANLLAGSVSFFASNWVPTVQFDQYPNSTTAIATLILALSGLALLQYGPNAIFFGSFLGSGWSLLNQIADWFAAP
ncbi:MAG: hypothetical protein VX492_06065 [Candidatus Thermoplasmatota archaeon]|nr:hypothetical protein [Candidatus Thermoplasmatota archaeon]